MVLQSLSLCCEKPAPWGLRTSSSSRMCFCLLVALILEMLREVIQAKGHSSLTGQGALRLMNLWSQEQLVPGQP